MELRDLKISGEKLNLNNADVNVIGPKVIFEKCTVNSDCARGALIIAGLTMLGGEFIQKRRLANFHFSRVHFSGVNFRGKFVGCDFGDWESTEKASITDCNFSDADLDGCRFLNCDPQTIRFPRWPCFTILDPSKARSFVLARDWPSKIGISMDVYTDEDPECVAVCCNAARIAEENSLSLAEFRELLLPVPGIKIVE